MIFCSHESHINVIIIRLQNRLGIDAAPVYGNGGFRVEITKIKLVHTISIYIYKYTMCIIVRIIHMRRLHRRYKHVYKLARHGVTGYVYVNTPLWRLQCLS